MSTEPHKKQPKETVGGIRSLPKELWPSADRAAWEAACRPGVRLLRGGAASHLRPITQNDLARRYGYFLDFLSRSGRLDPEAEAGAHVTLENIEPWRPKSKWDRIVLSEVIIEAGLTLIAEGELATKLSKLTRARMVRNGLMLALLAQCPIRLKNFAALEIGRSIAKIDDTWWILLQASETKEKRADERPIEEDIGEALDKYLEVYRPILSGGAKATNALWIGISGQAMAQWSVGDVITETTRSTLGVAINPHLFRTAGVTTTAVHAGDKPHLGSALLHHRHPTVAQESYNRASSISAGRAYREIIQRFRRI
jgi:integrase